MMLQSLALDRQVLQPLFMLRPKDCRPLLSKALLPEGRPAQARKSRTIWGFPPGSQANGSHIAPGFNR